MMRRTTFERLGMLEEILYPNAFGDVALCAKAIEAGLKNYYFGTLLGLHYEMKTRGRCHEDVEYVAVSERYGHVFSHWMLRNLSYAELSESTPTFVPHGEHPFRYRVADRINNALKAVLGPTHPVVKSSIHRSWHTLRNIRSKMIQGRPINHGSWMKRLRRVDPAVRGPQWERDAVASHENLANSEEAMRRPVYLLPDGVDTRVCLRAGATLDSESFSLGDHLRLLL